MYCVVVEFLASGENGEMVKSTEVYGPFSDESVHSRGQTVKRVLRRYDPERVVSYYGVTMIDIN